MKFFTCEGGGLKMMSIVVMRGSKDLAYHGITLNTLFPGIGDSPQQATEKHSLLENFPASWFNVSQVHNEVMHVRF